MTTVVLVQQGGTGANSAEGALAALGAMANTGGTFSGQVNISSGGLVVTGNANIDSGTLFVDSLNNRVGVGTITPLEPLTVQGNVRINDGGVLKLLTTTGAERGTIYATQSTGALTAGLVIETSGDEEIVFKDAGEINMVIQGSGASGNGRSNVGIGISAPTSKLHVVGTANITSNLSVGGIVESRSGGFKFPDGTTQISAATGAPSLNTVSGTTVTAIKDNHYILTNASATTVTLPASPANGDVVWVTVVNSRVDNVIARNGQLLQGLSEDMTLDNQYTSAQLRYINSTYGWRLV